MSDDTQQTDSREERDTDATLQSVVGGGDAAQSARHPSLMEMLGVTFNDLHLLQSALLHRSLLHEHPERCGGLPSNERLEFLGDAVLSMLTAAWLYQHFPERSEGELSALRTALVRTSTLARFARGLDLGRHIRISRGAESARNQPTLLANTFEAVLGAIYLDQGIERAAAFLEPFLQQEIERIAAGESETDYRTRLQQLAQALYGVTPFYRIVSMSGPDHRREFTVEAVLGDEQVGVGSGTTKQRAAQEAARIACEMLNKQAQ